jgi:hypothetical protein
MTVTPLHKKVATASTRSPERESLGLAISNKRAVDDRLEAQRGAVERAERLVSDAESKMAASAVAVADAREQQARAVAEAVAAGQRQPPPGAVRTARAAETEAQDDLDAAKAALEQLGGAALAELEAEAASADVQVEVAINGLLAAERGSQVARELVARRQEISELLGTASFIHDRGGSRGRSGIFTPDRALSAPLESIAPMLDRVLEVGVTLEGLETARAHPIVEELKQFCEAARTDPDAELPPLS